MATPSIDIFGVKYLSYFLFKNFFCFDTFFVRQVSIAGCKVVLIEIKLPEKYRTRSPGAIVIPAVNFRRYSLAKSMKMAKQKIRPTMA